MGIPRASTRPGAAALLPAERRGGRRIRGLDAEQRREQRREQLLAAAFELFARDGYVNTSMDRICQTACVGYKGFYELFDGKEDCYLALLRQVSEQIERRVSEAMRQSVEEGEEKDETVRRVLSAFAHALVDDPRVAVVTFGQAPGISPRVEAQRRENRRWAASFVEAFWRRSRPAGSGARDGADHHVLAIAAVGALFETVTDRLHQADSPHPTTIDNLTADLITVMSVFEAGITARDSAGRAAPVGG